MGNIEEPAERAAQLTRVVPFALLGVLVVLLSLVPPHAPNTPVYVAGAAVLFTLTVVITVVVRWEGQPGWVEMVPVATLCLGVALLRHSPGAYGSGYGPLLVLAVLWQALYGRRQELIGTWVLVVLTLAAPIVLIGAPQYPATQWRLVVLLSATAGVVGWIVHDLNTVRDRLLDRLDVLAHSDALTGLPNRRNWDEQLEQAATPGRATSVALIDIDHFKAYNDLHGHLAGDALLQRLATQLQDGLRAQDHLARWGGEEFALLLPDTTATEAGEVLHGLLTATSDEVRWSAGVATTSGGDVSALVAEADHMLYEAKRRGRAVVASRSGLRRLGHGAHPGAPGADPTPGDPSPAGPVSPPMSESGLGNR